MHSCNAMTSMCPACPLFLAIWPSFALSSMDSLSFRLPLRCHPFFCALCVRVLCCVLSWPCCVLCLCPHHTPPETAAASLLVLLSPSAFTEPAQNIHTHRPSLSRCEEECTVGDMSAEAKASGSQVVQQESKKSMPLVDGWIDVQERVSAERWRCTEELKAANSMQL
jgi:hypothetical protein